MNNLAFTNITKIVQIVGVASEIASEVETTGMDWCTLIHSNFPCEHCLKYDPLQLHPQIVLFSRLVQVTHCITTHRNIVSQALTWNSYTISFTLEISHLRASISNAHLPADDLQTTLVKACSNSADHMAITWFSKRNVIFTKWLPELDSVKTLVNANRRLLWDKKGLSLSKV